MAQFKRSKKNRIIVCFLVEDMDIKQYARYIKYLNKEMNMFFTPHYVVDSSDKYFELLDPDYIADATGDRDIDLNSISIVYIIDPKNEPTMPDDRKSIAWYIDRTVMCDIIWTLCRRYPNIEHELYTSPEDLDKCGIFVKDAFPRLS